jgi:hypothetical protein
VEDKLPVPEIDPLPWLLEADTPAVRYLALRDLAGLQRDDAVLVDARDAAYSQGPIATILDAMNPAGYWVDPGPGYYPKYRSTVWSLILLAQLGAEARYDARIAQACAYILDVGLTPLGQFTASGAPSGTADCLQGNLCEALVSLGYDDPRLDLAFEWMARTVTGEGIAPASDRGAASRYYAGKCGPLFACGSNAGLSCAWGAVKVMLAFGRWPVIRRTALIERAILAGVDFLFSCDPATAAYPTGYSSRPSGNWCKFGFPVFYVTDLLQLVEALGRLGYGEDSRLAHAVALVREKGDIQGRWKLEYDYAGKTWAEFGSKREPNKWVTLRALCALKWRPLVGFGSYCLVHRLLKSSGD